jgi:hypothetical protein
MTSLADLLGDWTASAQPEPVSPAQANDAKMMVALPMLLRDETLPKDRRRVLTRQWEKVEQRIARRQRQAREHGTRLRMATVAMPKFNMHQARRRERSDTRSSRTRSRSPDDGDGQPGSSSRRRRGRSDEGWTR